MGVTNVDCWPIAVPTDVAGTIIRQVSGIELPSGPIDAGTTAVVRLPVGTYEVELRSDRVRVAWLSVVVEQPLPEPARPVAFEGHELVGAGTLDSELADGRPYRLRLACSSWPAVRLGLAIGLGSGTRIPTEGSTSFGWPAPVTMFEGSS